MSKNKIRGFFGLLIDLIFPPRCAVCGDVIPLRLEACPECLCRLADSFSAQSLCPRCGKPVASCVCEYLSAVSVCVSALEYGDETRELLLRLKQRRNSPAAAQLAGLMAERFSSLGFSAGGFDLVTAVPAGEDKPFNHAESLGRALAEKLSLPFAAPPIRRAAGYLPQHTLSAAQRRQNALNGFEPLDGASVSGRILLVDDIVTTGATLERCASLLLELGASEVYCITAATTPFSEHQL